MKRIIILLIVLLAALSVSAVSAEDNLTDVVAEDIDAEPVAAEIDDLEDIVSNEVETNQSTSQITSSKVTGYESFATTVSLELTADGKPLASKPVSILLNGKTYKRVTDNNGKASLSLYLNAGTYTAQFTYLGDNMTTNATGTCSVLIKEPVKTSLKVGDKYINYRQGSKCLFFVKLVDEKGNPIKYQTVKFRVAGKNYFAKTNKLGYAKIFLNLKKGKYKVRYSFYKTSPYLYSKGAHVIKVKAKMAKGNGYWLWPMHMKSLNLKSLASRGTKHIFLQAYAVSAYGKSSVESFIKKAHSYGMKVHLWMPVCYDGNNWVSPVRDDGSFKYAFLNKKISEAVRYAKMSGVDGIHFDYMRFGGTAHIHKNSVKVINYFAKKASTKIHSVRPNCMVSVAIMPEPSAMIYYYGQDVPTLSKYVDALLPMVYKGNYNQPTSWITSVTKKFVSQSNGAQIWTGLQAYHSDSYPKTLSHSLLLKDAKAAMKGGAKGVVLFRVGISCNLNFKLL